MNIAVITLLALLSALFLSMVSRINVGIVAIAAAWIVGVYLAGDKPEKVIEGFPVNLFVTLAGTTFLFAMAEANQTFSGVAAKAMRMIGDNRLLVPILFFGIALLVSAVGPGAISSVALVVPLAAQISARSNLPPMLTALMVANGANAGSLSPISAVGIIVNSRMAEAGVGGHEGLVMAVNLVAHIVVACAAYAWFFPKLLTDRTRGRSEAIIIESPRLGRQQMTTLAVVSAWVLSVIFLKFNLGLSAFAAGVVLIVARVGDERAAINRMPWGVILMVCGVALLISLVEDHGGTAQFGRLIAMLASPSSINGVIAVVTGVISTYSSTSGVVLPTFLPTVPGIVQSIGGGNPLEIALSINVGSSLVDVSPLSTLGALCLAALAKEGDGRSLFYKLLAWGLAMTLAGAMFAQFIVPLFVSS